MISISSGAVIPLFNSSIYLDDLFASLAYQTKKLNQVVLIDDCSQDNTVAKVNFLMDKYKSLSTDFLLLTNKNNLGVSNSVNLGISELSTDLIFFSGHDDIWRKCRVEISSDYLSSGKNFIHSFYQTFGLNSSCAKPSSSLTDIALGMLNGNKIGAITVALHMKNIGKKNIFFNSRFNGAEDYDLWTDLIISGERPYCIPEILMDYRLSDTQISSNFDYKNTPLLRNIQIKYYSNLFPSSILCYFEIIRNISQFSNDQLKLIKIDSSIKPHLQIILNTLENENSNSWFSEIYLDLIIRLKLLIN
jgi:glycosyltransferase involved in cell wall biosynthesis